MAERRPMTVSVRAGDEIRWPHGHVEDEHGNVIRELYDTVRVVAGSCVVEVSGFGHAKIVRVEQNSSGKVKIDQQQ